MDIPQGIEKEIVSYIRLECGEKDSDPNALQESDLVYEGEFEIEGIPTHYWRCGSESRTWATVEPFGDSYCLGMTSSSPIPVKKSNLYRFLKLEDLSGGVSESIPLEAFGEGAMGLPNYQEITLGKGETIAVLAEAQTYSAPPAVTISIRERQREVYIRASIGVALSYSTFDGNEILLSIGTGPWE